MPFDLTLPRFTWLANRFGQGGAARPSERPAPTSHAKHVSGLPVAPSRFRSIAWPLIGVLVLVAGWTVGISYYFHHQSA